MHKALYKALYTKALHKALHEALRTKTLYTETLCIKALHRVPAIFLIASIHAFAKYTPYIATLFFTLPFFFISSLLKEVLERQLAEDYC